MVNKILVIFICQAVSLSDIASLLQLPEFEAEGRTLEQDVDSERAAVMHLYKLPNLHLVLWLQLHSCLS